MVRVNYRIVLEEMGLRVENVPDGRLAYNFAVITRYGHAFFFQTLEQAYEIITNDTRLLQAGKEDKA